MYVLFYCYELPWLRFFRAFSSVVRQSQGIPRKDGARPALFLISELCCSVYCFVSIVLFYVLFVCKCVLYCCHRVPTQLQLNISYHIISYHIISYHIIYHISYHISYISYHISYHIIYRIVSYHIISYHIIYIISYHIIYHIISCIISYHIISYKFLHLPPSDRHSAYRRSKRTALGQPDGFYVGIICLVNCFR